MVVTLLLILLIVVVLIVLCIALCPIGCRVQGGYADGQFTGACTCSLLHPRFFSLSFDTCSRVIAINVAGFRLGHPAQSRKRDESPPEPQAQSNGALFGTEAADEPQQEADAVEHPQKLPQSTNEKVRAGESRVYKRSIVDVDEEDVAEPLPVPTSSATEQQAESATGSEEPDARSAQSMHENMAEKGNWWHNTIVKLKRNRYVYFVMNRAWRTKVLRWVIRFFRSLFYIVTFDRFALSLRAGVEDPVVLGTVYGFIEAVTFGLSMEKKPVIRLEPLFMQNHFEASGAFRLRTSLLQLSRPLIGAVVTFPFLTTGFLWLRHRRIVRKTSQTEVA